MNAVFREIPDEILLERFNEGHVDAFEELLARYRRPVFNFVLRSVRDVGRAEEILQEVFLRVVQRSGEFRGHSKFSTWLYTIARNQCIDHGRKMAFRRHASLDAPSHASEGDQGPTLLDRVASQGPGSDREAIGRQLKEAIERAIEELPEEQREVFLMRQVQNLAFKDIATVVGTSENTVKSRMRYALERLQGALAEYEDYLEQLK
ncbi:MAG: RNA polymerase sigma factor [Polyangiaceae bacterium]|nr:RNA polymerase sigma factor [Polyangiaceae bacterium]